MREIKFRAWHKGSEDSRGRVAVEPQMLHDEWPGECLLYAHQRQPVELMQYTGLKDKNGWEIWEGDILSWNSPHVTGTWTVEATMGGWNPFINTGTTDRPDRYVVIGNIHENPELLKEQAKCQ